MPIMEGKLAQLVFVHGVATREGADYDTTVNNRTRLFKTVAFADVKTEVRNPYWGSVSPVIDSHVYATASADNAFSLNIRSGGSFPLGGGDIGIAEDDLNIASIGQDNANTAIDTIFCEVLDAADREARELSEDEVAAFAKAVDLIETDYGGSVFAGVDDDLGVAKALQDTTGDRSYGLASTIRDAVSAASDRVRNAVSTIGSKALKSYSPAVGVFLGDVFVYLKQDKARDSIRQIILKNLLEAFEASQKNGGEPIILVGHSLGGVILADMLMDPAAADLPKDFKVEVLFTVGSQPGFFAALNLLAGNNDAPAKRARPACVGAWYNVFDPVDPFAFRADAAFADVSDVEFDSVTGLLAAHSAYFHRPQFYARFRSRLRQHGVLPKS